MVTATFTAILYTITIDGNIENGGVTADPAGTATVNKTATLTVTANGGYQLSGTPTVTYGEAQPVAVSGGQSPYTFQMPAGNVTVTASFTPTPYTITYNLNGGTNAGGNPAQPAGVSQSG